MQCSEFEVRLCEYLDGTLDQAARREVEQHAAGCSLCAALLADSGSVRRFLETVDDIEAPGELVTNILYRTRHARSAFWVGWKKWFRPLLGPRFAMSMAMTILSVSMLYRVAGVQIRQLEVADLNPVRIWQTVDNGAHRVWNRGVKFYQSVRFIYEIMSQWRELQSEEEQVREPEKRAEPTMESQPAGKTPRDPQKLEPSPAPAGKKAPG